MYSLANSAIALVYPLNFITIQGKIYKPIIRPLKNIPNLERYFQSILESLLDRFFTVVIDPATTSTLGQDPSTFSIEALFPSGLSSVFQPRP